MKKYLFIIAAVAVFAVYNANAVDKSLLSKNMVNEAAYIPSQCYTITETDKKEVFNPCYSCHKNSTEPNYINDVDLQAEYILPEYADTNHWTNLFVDRTERVAKMKDSAILEYVRTDNYKDKDGKIILAEKLKNVPAEWDFDENGAWAGYVPDCYFSFDAEGFDRDPKGAYTGWRAYAYAPFLGTFWPTNGSTDDVLIKLADSFMRDADGKFSLEVYKLNLAIVEALIKQTDVKTDMFDENTYGIDLDKNGKLGKTDTIKYDWAPLEGKNMSYAGLAGELLKKGKLHLAAGLFPEGTEFLHSVRYINVDGKGEIGIAPRMKELRYAVKRKWYDYGQLKINANEEVKEDNDFPDRLGYYYGDIEHGLSNNSGWMYQGFIEAKDGSLRPQTYEETVFCMGCHNTIGATADGIFTYGRKFDHTNYKKGWYHWSEKGLKGIPEHKVEYEGKGNQYEYSFYLMQNSAGDEFRENEEVIAKFFTKDGKIKQDMIEKLHKDISILLIPSPERAIKLNKAYKTIVEDQSFVYGRDANVAPVKNVYKKVEPSGRATGVTEPVVFGSEDRLYFEK